ncbi:hypothetical protein [uncultured Intestinimonas sp.]|uniref:hypothetical protein n=1 Tax=uncultured Intestinimonas sp. TaxID=1689265 RepID=UPI00294366EF|nr:hypothetical protein [uncultured Intestinimonas sp.]
MTGEKRRMTGGSDDSKGARAAFAACGESGESGLCDDEAQAGASGVKVAQVISSRLK